MMLYSRKHAASISVPQAHPNFGKCLPEPLLAAAAAAAAAAANVPGSAAASELLQQAREVIGSPMTLLSRVSAPLTPPDPYLALAGERDRWLVCRACRRQGSLLG